jgi:hypothetical protein
MGGQDVLELMRNVSEHRDRQVFGKPSKRPGPLFSSLFRLTSLTNAK